MFVQACKEDTTPRQQNWPNIIAGELIHSLSLLPSLMQKECYKDSHFLQCIIRMQAYNYGAPQTPKKRQPGLDKEVLPSEFSKQVQYLVVFKENLF